MPTGNLLDDIIAQLQAQAGSRGATFAGRQVGQAPTTAQQLISQPAIESPDEGFSLPPELLARLSPLMAGVLSKVGKTAVKELGPLEKIIIERGKAGAPMLIDNFRPRLTHRTTGRNLVGRMGGHHADLYEQIPRNSSVRDWEHGFATIEGHPLSDEIAHLLTGPPELLGRAATMIESGTPLDLISQAIKDMIAKIGYKP